MKNNDLNAELIEIKAEILKYLPDDLHYDYDDGSFEWFDGVKMRFLEPPSFQGKEIVVYFESSKDIDKNLKIIAQTVTFNIKHDILERNGEIFIGALQNIKYIN